MPASTRSAILSRLSSRTSANATNPSQPKPRDAMIHGMSTERSDDATRRGEGALLRGEWDEARAAFEESLAREASAAALDGLARALWWLADSQGAISAWERAYTALRGVGDRDRSARVALLLAEEYGEGRGNEAAANGWLARARDLLGDERSSTVGWLGVAAARSTSDPAAARELAAEALDIGRRLAIRTWSWSRWDVSPSPSSRWARSRTA